MRMIPDEMKRSNRRSVTACALKRNGAMPMDGIASRYLDEIPKNLVPLTTWRR